MASSQDYVEYVCEQLRGNWDIRYRKMFGEYAVYINEKPIVLVADNTVYIKIIDELKTIMGNAETGTPYEGAKERYILDIDNRDLCMEAISILESVTPVPVPKKKKGRK